MSDCRHQLSKENVLLLLLGQIYLSLLEDIKWHQVHGGIRCISHWFAKLVNLYFDQKRASKKKKKKTLQHSCVMGNHIYFVYLPPKSCSPSCILHIIWIGLDCLNIAEDIELTHYINSIMRMGPGKHELVSSLEVLWGDIHSKVRSQTLQRFRDNLYYWSISDYRV